MQSHDEKENLETLPLLRKEGKIDTEARYAHVNEQ